MRPDETEEDYYRELIGLSEDDGIDFLETLEAHDIEFYAQEDALPSPTDDLMDVDDLDEELVVRQDTPKRRSTRASLHATQSQEEDLMMQEDLMEEEMQEKRKSVSPKKSPMKVSTGIHLAKCDSLLGLESAIPIEEQEYTDLYPDLNVLEPLPAIRFPCSTADGHHQGVQDPRHIPQIQYAPSKPIPRPCFQKLEITPFVPSLSSGNSRREDPDSYLTYNSMILHSIRNSKS
jgi:hypothetical protein